MTKTKKIVLGITGASGSIYPKIFLEEMRQHPEYEVFVVASSNGERVFFEETKVKLKEFWPNLMAKDTFDVPFVSGSALANGYLGMVIMPASMGTVARVAHGISSDTVTRAADVFIKEQKKLIVVARETPMSTIHLKNLLALSESGALILPAIPHFYSGQSTLIEVASTVVARVLDHLSISHSLTRAWKSES